MQRSRSFRVTLWGRLSIRNKPSVSGCILDQRKFPQSKNGDVGRGEDGPWCLERNSGLFRYTFSKQSMSSVQEAAPHLHRLLLAMKSASSPRRPGGSPGRPVQPAASWTSSTWSPQLQPPQPVRKIISKKKQKTHFLPFLKHSRNLC